MEGGNRKKFFSVLQLEYARTLPRVRAYLNLNDAALGRAAKKKLKIFPTFFRVRLYWFM